MEKKIGFIRIIREPSLYMGSIDIVAQDVDGKNHKITAPCSNLQLKRIEEHWNTDEAFNVDLELPNMVCIALWQMGEDS